MTVNFTLMADSYDKYQADSSFLENNRLHEGGETSRKNPFSNFLSKFCLTRFLYKKITKTDISKVGDKVINAFKNHLSELNQPTPKTLAFYESHVSALKALVLYYSFESHCITKHATNMADHALKKINGQRTFLVPTMEDNSLTDDKKNQQTFNNKVFALNALLTAEDLLNKFKIDPNNVDLVIDHKKEISRIVF